MAKWQSIKLSVYDFQPTSKSFEYYISQGTRLKYVKMNA